MLLMVYIPEVLRYAKLVNDRKEFARSVKLLMVMNQAKQIETQLVALTQKFLSELSRDCVYSVTLSASLEKDLDIGSLEKAELLSRVEKSFSIQLTDNALTEVKTIADLCCAIQHANPPRMLKTEWGATLPGTTVNVEHATTLLEVLFAHAKAEPNRPHIYFQDAAGHEEILTHHQLQTRATAVAIGLQKKELKKGDTVAIMLPTSLDFFVAFLGIVLAGCVPVPIYPPFRVDQIESYIRREASILNSAATKLLITFQRAEMISRLLKNFIPHLKYITTVEALSVNTEKKIQFPFVTQDDAALIQYTSGSTGNPKGVLLTHHNLLSNIRAYGKAVALCSQDVCVSWLPLYHDMGLIGAWLGSFYHGAPLVLLSPLTFLVRPERWLWAIHYHHGTVSAAPNFAYELCVRKIDPTMIEGLDLNTWRLTCNGAEAVLPDTLEHFYQKFSSYGLRREILCPVYGLAETSLALTVPTMGQCFRVDRIARHVFEENQIATPSNDTNKNNILEFVGCGKVLTDHHIRIVDQENHVLPERHVGRLQFSGPSSMQGYYRNDAATALARHDEWWETGDMAYVSDEELFITGRQKDVIVKAGRNFYPETAEMATASVFGIRKGCVVAFGVRDATQATEKFIIVAETHEKNRQTKEDIIHAVRKKVVEALSVPPDDIVLVAPKTIPKTSSGKLQRTQCRTAYLIGKLTARRAPVVWQITKLFFIGCIKKLLHLALISLRFLYFIYLALLLLFHFPLVYFSIMLSPYQKGRQYTRFWMRWLFFCGLCSLRVKGKENIIKGTPTVYVSNHASYIDAAVLLAVFPSHTALVGKKELLQMPLLKTFIRKLKFLTLDRDNWMKSQMDVTELVKTLRSGDNLGLFPEGTFTYQPGLLPFKAGAFKAAVEAGAPICTVALRGTRYFLPEHRWLPFRCTIDVTVSKAIYPRRSDWQEVSHLRELAYQEILAHCGEKPTHTIEMDE